MNLLSGLKKKEVANLGLFSISLIPVILFVFVVLQRLVFPFDLEWGEGAGINQIYHILSGKQIYGPPALDFMPLVYTPFYYWLASLFAGSFQAITVSARIVSALCSIGAAGIIAWLIIKDTGNKMAGWLASAVYFSCFALSDGFYDLVRVDSLYVLLLLISFSLLRKSSRPARMAAAGLSIAVGFFTKQSTLIVFFPLIIYFLVKYRRSSWPLLLGALLGVIVPIIWINARSDGWFIYYILRLPREHGYSLISAVDFWVGDLLGPLGISAGFGLFYLVFQLPGRHIGIAGADVDTVTSGEDKSTEASADQFICHLLFAVGAIGSAFITRASIGGGANNVMSAYASMAVLFGLGFSRAENLSERLKDQGGKFRAVVYGLAAVQLLGLMYNPFNFLPSPAEVDANNLLLARIEQVDGSIWIPYRSHLPGLADKETYIHAVNLFELTGYFRGDVLAEGSDLVNQLREKICYQSFGLVVLDQQIPWIETQLYSAYQLDTSFAIPRESRRSTQLSWQGGFDAVYVPLMDYDLQGCLESIDHGGEG